MPDLPATSAEDQGTDEYQLTPEESPPPAATFVPPRAAEPGEPPRDAQGDQFTLGELLGVVAAAAVVCSVISSIARWMSPGNTPGELAGIFAAVLGLMALAGMILAGLGFHQPDASSWWAGGSCWVCTLSLRSPPR